MSSPQDTLSGSFSLTYVHLPLAVAMRSFMNINLERPRDMELEGTVGPTQDFVDGDCEDYEDEDAIWGRLFPLSSHFAAQGCCSVESSVQACHVLFSVEFTNDEYTFGREKTCDYCFDTSVGRKNPNLAAISKVHFRIYKVGWLVHI